MNIIDLDSALNTLGLNKNYTEEQLKRAYRNLIIKYHPDFYVNKSDKEKKVAEEKTKDINAAKEILEKHLKCRANVNIHNDSKKDYNSNNVSSRSRRYYYDNYNLNLKKEEFKREIDNYINDLNNISNDSEISATKHYIMRIFNFYRGMIDDIVTEYGITKLKEKFYNQLANALENYAKIYCKKYNIIANINKLEKKSIKILYQQLNELRINKQNKKILFKPLDELYEKYKLYAGFTAIEKEVVSKKNIIEKEYTDGLLTMEQCISKFDNVVMEEFEDYYKRLDLLNKLKTLKINNGSINYFVLIDKLESNISNSDCFWSIAYGAIDLLEQYERLHHLNNKENELNKKENKSYSRRPKKRKNILKKISKRK